MTEETIKVSFQDSFTTYGDAIFRFCLVKVSNSELAEDMTQEVFMRYWQYLRDQKEITNERSLLYTIANNMAKDWYKKKKSSSLDDRLDAGLEPVSDENIEVGAQYREALAVIDEMPEPERTYLLLKHVEGLPPKDIAEICGESTNVVSVRTHRAEGKLKEQFHHE